MNFTINQTFTLTTDDQQQLTYTIKDIDECGRLLVHSSLLEMAFFWKPEMFEAFLKVIGYKEPAKYKVWLINFNRYFGPNNEYETFDSALEAGKLCSFEFRIELGGMICATWSPLGGLRVMTEYQAWVNDQQYMLAKMEGSYP